VTLDATLYRRTHLTALSGRKIPVKYLILIVAGLASTGLAAGQGAEYVNSYFELWLKDHKYDGFEKRSDGVYFRDNGIVLDGEIYGVNELDKDQRYSVETRLSVKFPGGRQLDEFVAGIGAKPEEAFLDSLNNFCLATLHPIYAEIADKDDPHVQKERWKIGKYDRNVFFQTGVFGAKNLARKHKAKLNILLATSCDQQTCQRKFIGRNSLYPI
jgi:hypothetical protein